MKKTIFILSVLLISCNAFAQDKQARHYEVKSGIIHYEISGNTTGTAELYFDDYGKTSAEYEKSVQKSFGVSTKTDGVTYFNYIKRMTYHIDNIENMATKSEIPPIQFQEGDITKEEAYEGLGFEKTGSETILGKKCITWKGWGSTISEWKGIPLKTTGKVLGQKYVKVATKIDLSSRPPSSKLNPPSNVDYKTQEDFMREAMQENDDIEIEDSEDEESMDAGEALNALGNLFKEAGKEVEKEAEDENSFTNSFLRALSNDEDNDKKAGGMNISFTEFKNVMKKVKVAGYSFTTADNDEENEEYNAFFMKGMSMGMVINATKGEDLSMVKAVLKMEDGGKFTINGNECTYGTFNDSSNNEDASVLIIEIKNKNTALKISSKFLDKENLKKIAKQIDF